MRMAWRKYKCKMNNSVFFRETVEVRVFDYRIKNVTEVPDPVVATRLELIY